MLKLRGDLTPVVDLTGEKGTGPARARRPVYVNSLPPCEHGCSAGEDIHGWMALAQEGRHHEAWDLILQDNPLPATLGRVCFRKCEDVCNRHKLDAAVQIHSVERYLGDLAIEEQWTPRIERPATGKRVLVIGSGPGGLSAGYHLARLGHAVEIREASAKAGGLLQYAIPSFRLPRAVIDDEIRQIERMGVRIVLNSKVLDVLSAREAGHFDAVFLAVGAQAPRHVDIPVRDAAKVFEAASLLSRSTGGESLRLGRRVVVFGGGDQAVDAARVALRSGAEETLVVYQRDPRSMGAHPGELASALAEGVKVRWLTAVKELSGESITVEEVKLDPKGRPTPTGKTETLAADTLVLALGQDSDSSFLRQVPGIAFKPDGTVQVGANLMTGHPGLFAGGDLISSDQVHTVTAAIGRGKLAARHIDAWLRGESYTAPAPRSILKFGQLTLPLFTDADPSQQREREAAARRQDFGEVAAGLSGGEATYEAQRCVCCGNCFECDQCFAACPEHALSRLGPGLGYRIDLERCTGCAVCAEQCPAHAMQMVLEPSQGAVL